MADKISIVLLSIAMCLASAVNINQDRAINKLTEDVKELRSK